MRKFKYLPLLYRDLKKIMKGQYLYNLGAIISALQVTQYSSPQQISGDQEVLPIQDYMKIQQMMFCTRAHL